MREATEPDRGPAPPTRSLRPRAGRSRSLTAAACGLLAAAALAAAASAQLPAVGNPFEEGEQRVEELRATSGQDLDTDYTPHAKDGSQIWKQIGGARFGSASGERAEESIGITRYDDNLFAVSFVTPEHGLVGGARCGDPDDKSDFPKSNPDLDGEEDCVPVLYRYTDDPLIGKPRTWEQVKLPGGAGDPNGDERPGYIGAIAWIDADRALAVGGTGTYPRREPPYGKDLEGGNCAPPSESSGEPYGANCDQAGMARAWLLRIEGTEERWCELKPGSGEEGCPALPRDDPATARFEGMRGLTATAFRRDEAETLGFVGGLGQIWEWRQTATAPAEGFSKLYDNHSPQDELEQIEGNTFPSTKRPMKLFRFRVRQIRFVPGPKPAAFAVTSGCCGARDTATPLFMTYTITGTASEPGSPLGLGNVKPKWVVRRGLNVPFSGEEPLDREELPPGVAQTGALQPDSYYSVATVRNESNASFPTADRATLSATASTNSPLERRSTIICRGGSGQTPHPNSDRSGPTASFSTGRLVSIDGPQTITKQATCEVDWAVGELRKRQAEGRGRQGLVSRPRTADRTPPPTDVPIPAVCSAIDKCGSDQVEYATGQVKEPHPPTDPERVKAHLASLDLGVGSYSLNQLDMVGATGTGYAVGDHGAILALTSADTRTDKAASEPDAPRLGARTPAPLSNAAPYASLRPAVGGGATTVPALSARPREQLAEPRLAAMGSPDASKAFDNGDNQEDVSAMVMSRDGTDGWAVGADAAPGLGRIEDKSFGNAVDAIGTLSLFHFDGATWRRCDPLGVRGQLEPDPACAAVAGLARPHPIGGLALRRVRLTSLARVPLERDSNPANDDDFEVVAIGTRYRGLEQPAADDPVILRLKDGRWRFEERARRLAVTGALPEPVRSEPDVLAAGISTGSPNLVLKDVAFTAPDDGWILARDTSANIHRLFRFDGERWAECVRVGESCSSLRVPRLGDDAYLRLTAAGERVYLSGSRRVVRNPGVLANASELIAGANRYAPLIIYSERGGSHWTDGSGAGEDGDGFDPGCARYDETAARCIPAEDGGQGRLFGLTVGQRPDGAYEGLAVVKLYDHQFPMNDAGNPEGASVPPPDAVLMRLEHEGGRGRWRPFHDPGALEDYLAKSYPARSAFYSEQQLMTLSGGLEGGGLRAVVAPSLQGRLFGYSAERERFELAQSDLPPSARGGDEQDWDGGGLRALASDGNGGAWVAHINQPPPTYGWSPHQLFFHHYTDRPAKPVFDESAHPFGDRDLRFTSLSATRDGTVWLGTNTAQIARYDRRLGWETVRIPGWDPGRVVTKESAVSAVAVNDAGSGIAVGEQGRIADLSPDGVVLDPAAGRRCVDDPAPPCGTSRDLHAAAIAPDGSALVGGDGMTVLHRPAGEQFRAPAKPPGGSAVRITGISLPTPERAYLATDSGYVYVGERRGADEWSWRAENLSGRTVLGSETPLRAIAVNAEGRGYAVGERGVVLYRDGDSRQPWRRIRGPGSDDLSAVTLPRGGGDSVLIGGRHGVVWTGEREQLSVARPGDYFYAAAVQYGHDEPPFGPTTGPAVGLAVLPGGRDGQAEAWVALQARAEGTNHLLHYGSDDDPLINPGQRTRALPDTPARRDGELTLAAFGKSDCQLAPGAICTEMNGARDLAEVVSRRIVAELERQAGRLDLALHTGDASDSTGYPSGATVPLERTARVPAYHQSAWTGRLKHRRFSEFVIDPLERAGVPLFGAVGAGDLSRPTSYCGDTGCGNPAEQTIGGEHAKLGENAAWRDGMERRAAPWGRGDPQAAGTRLSFSETPGATTGGQELPELEAQVPGATTPAADPGLDTPGAKVPNEAAGALPPSVPREVAPGHPRLGSTQSPSRRAQLRNGARTHYSVEVERGEQKLARIVVVDTSLRSLSASDAIQNPIERSGQLQWLERMLCFEGQVAAGGRCTREPGQQAIVLSNTPTYSYGPGAAATQTDSAAMERVLLQYRASLVVSGRLGWNGRYWATAPGVHEPCPGEGFRQAAPEPGTRVCGRNQDEAPAPAAAPQAEGVGEALDALGPPPEPVAGPSAQVEGAVSDSNPTGLVPFVVAAAAGGKFGPRGENQTGSATDGFFHGYTIVRLDPDGDPRGVIVEQRPILDWISLTAQEHTLRPGQRLTLRGVGRGPIAFRASGDPAEPMTRYARINSAAITHRYDLVLADPEEPYLPRKDADGNYVPIPSDVASVDRETGIVRAGRGSRERTYAMAILSVGQQVASWPLVFEPAKSFRAKPAPVIPLPLPPRAPAPAPPQIRVLGQPPVPPPPTPPPPAQLPNLAELSLPAPPALPPLPQAANATPVSPPPPPAPPAPPVNPPAQPLALNALLGQVGVNAAPIPPNAPAVNPAPPSGSAARKEAKQRQAATAKSEEGGNPRGQDAAGDLGGSSNPDPGSSAFTRGERTRPEPSFTALGRPDQPSAWSRGALYGGSAGLAALVLGFAWLTARPTPRRRRPELPAPALARARSRGRW